MAETEPIRRRKALSVPFAVLFSALVPVVAAVIFYRLDPFDPAALPLHELSQLPPAAAPKTNGHMLAGAEFVGVGKMVGPEDIVYDAKSKVVYTGTADGWVKRVKVMDSANDSAVEDWVRTGGRPLGITLSNNDEVIVADAYKGLLKISREGKIEVLVNEAEGVRFKLTDGVDVAEDGIIYFTDASYKYELHDFALDILEGKPFARFLSYDPKTGKTAVLAKDLYFANGVAISPIQDFVIFCETPMRRCKKYYRQGERKGSIENFIDNLPGFPDNIRYDGEGYYWIAISSGMTYAWELAFKYPIIRKVAAIMEKYTGRPSFEKNAGVLQVDLEGKPVAHYFDPKLILITGGLKVGDHLYCGSVIYPYIIRLDLNQYPAQSPA